MVGADKGHTLHQLTKFRKDRPNRCGDIVFFCDFQDGGCRHLEFSKIVKFDFFNDRSIKKPFLHQSIKFRKDRRYRVFCDLQDGGYR